MQILQNYYSTCHSAKKISYYFENFANKILIKDSRRYCISLLIRSPRIEMKASAATFIMTLKKNQKICLKTLKWPSSINIFVLQEVIISAQ